jgi:hypothetical protein
MLIDDTFSFNNIKNVIHVKIAKIIFFIKSHSSYKYDINILFKIKELIAL